MACNYSIKKFGDVASSISQTHKRGKERLIFLNTSDVLHGNFLHEEYSLVQEWPGQAKKAICKGDILFSEIRPANGRWAFVDRDAEDFVVSTKLMVIRAKAEIADPQFLYQFLTSQETTRWLQHLAESRSGTFPQITFDQVAALDLPLPPVSEQRAIAKILGTMDDKIGLNRQMNGTLEAIVQTLYRSWFVDFDPVYRNVQGSNSKLEDRLFPASFESDIPKGWEIVRLDQIATIKMGLSPSGDSYNAEGEGKPLINGPVEFGDYFPVKTKWSDAATRFAIKDDLIFCVRGSTTGKRVISDGEYAIGRGVCAIGANDGFHSFLYQTINFGLERMLSKTTGSVFPSLSAPDIKSFKVVKPPKAIIEAFEHITKPLLERIQNNCRESSILSNLRDTLLPKLLTGEISTTTKYQNQS